MVNTLHANDKLSRSKIDDSFFLFSQKIGFDISCRLSRKETICMKCQNLFSTKNKKNYLKTISVEIFCQHAKVHARRLILNGRKNTTAEKSYE